ncbi:MAG: glycosyltransferase family 39 protein [Proteobacteria bacterium]|nr:glycosyltransferase family 39 protein [Pseudomonadota bacterium]
MIALGAVLLEVLGCLGFGAATLRLLRVDESMTVGEHWALAFAAGFGILGWLMFPIGVSGYLSEQAISALLAAGALGALLLRRPNHSAWRLPSDGVGRALWVLLAIIAGFGLAQGLAPPADADTLSYHFAVPQEFLAAGRIDFIPQALEGAIPFGIQMTYAPALALGGEMALTLWTMISGWAAAALFFVLCRRHLDHNWSLALTLIFLTTPTVIYGSGSGQVELRISLFVMLGAWATARAVETGQIRYAVLAGLSGGFYAAAKYTGLLFVAALGGVLLFQRRWFLHGTVFGIAALAAGFQWYAWNAIHTGDPVFPALFQWLGREDLIAWTRAYDLDFKAFLFHSEVPLPQTLMWLLLLPFKATLAAVGLPDAGRVGFGPYGLLVLPFALMGLWQGRGRVRQSPLLVYAGITAFFYVLWFFIGGSQRIRHLLPILPLLLLCLTVAAERLTRSERQRAPLVALMVATLSLQMAGAGLYSLNYLKFLAGGADREKFLARNINNYFAVGWINTNLKKTDKVFISHRNLRYYLDIPTFFETQMQAAIEVRPEHTNAQKFYRQSRKAGITHFLVTLDKTDGGWKYFSPINILDDAGCLMPVKQFQGRLIWSRTLPGLNTGTRIFALLALKDKNCLDKPPS